MMNVFQGAGRATPKSHDVTCAGRDHGLGIGSEHFPHHRSPHAFLLGVIQHSQLVQLAAALSKTNGLM